MKKGRCKKAERALLSFFWTRYIYASNLVLLSRVADEGLIDEEIKGRKQLLTQTTTMAEGEDEKSVVGSGDEAEKKESRSPTRSASYSPSPPKSPPRTRTSRSPVESRRADDVARQSPSPRSARARQSWSPDERVPDRREAHSVEVVGLTRVIGESHLDHIFAYYGSIDEIILPTIRMSECYN